MQWTGYPGGNGTVDPESATAIKRGLRGRMTMEELRAVIEIVLAPNASPLKVDTIVLAARAYAGEISASDIQTERTGNAASV